MSMQAINSINRRIKDTEDQIKGITDAYEEPSEIAKFMLKELNRNLESLNVQREEIYKAQAKEKVSMRIYGESVEYGKISNRILLSVLGGFQSMVESIATFSGGAIATRGKITDTAKMITDFKITQMFAGSFGIVLEKDCGQLEITENATQTGVIMQDLFDILENSWDPNKLIEQISPYGKRTITHYREWLKALKDENINLEVDWTDESAEVHSLDIKHKTVSDIIFTLDSIENVSNEEVELIGILTGINIRKNTFELKCDKEIIKGTGKLETLIQMSFMIGQEIRTQLIKTISQGNGFVSRTTWHLEKVMLDKEECSKETSVSVL